MTYVPTADAIPLQLVTGKNVFWTVTSQSGLPQQVTLTDSNNNKIFSASGPSTGGQGPTLIGNGTFTAKDISGNYFLSIYANNKPSQAIYTEAPLNYKGMAMTTTYIVNSEDSTDNDYNDTCVILTWFQNAG
jgi:hypothetical protein